MGAGLQGAGKLAETGWEIFQYLEENLGEYQEDQQANQEAKNWYGDALLYYDTGRYNLSLKCITKCIEIKPGWSNAWALKGLIFDALDQYDDAINCYDEAIEINPRNVYAWNGKGIVLGELSEYEQAIECYDNAIAIDPSFSYAYTNRYLAAQALLENTTANDIESYTSDSYYGEGIFVGSGLAYTYNITNIGSNDWNTTDTIIVNTFPTSKSSPSTITVGPNGCNYTSIQDAIDAASPGDIIKVYSGTYYENVNVNKQITVLGVDMGSEMPVVDAGGSGSGITLSGSGVRLEGFITTNSSYGQAGIKVISNSNIITGNVANKNDYGIYLDTTNSNTVTDNTIDSNSNCGILLKSSNGNTVTGNTADSNSNCGILLDSSNGNTVTGNTADRNNNCGISLDSSNGNTVTGNTANSNEYGILLDSSNGNTVTNNIANKNAHGIWRESSNGNIISGNIIE